MVHSKFSSPLSALNGNEQEALSAVPSTEWANDKHEREDGAKVSRRQVVSTWNVIGMAWKGVAQCSHAPVNFEPFA